MDYSVSIREVAPEHIAGLRGTYPVAQLPQVMAGEFGRVMGVLIAEGVKPAGGAVAVYHDVTDDTVDVEIAFTIHGVYFPRDKKGVVKPGRLPGGKVAFTTHVGPYDKLEEAYTAVQAYAKANGVKLAGMMWERYLTGLDEEPDVNKHVTEIYWPLA
jgi:effector-binding domain-containing protein